jgi:ATP-binding cassette, subfamily F, member 3
MLSLVNVEVDFGTRLLFTGVTFLVQRGDRIGLVGRNGAGKSTLMHIIAGERQPTKGDVHRQNNIRVGLLSQDLTLDLSHTLRETALQAFEEVLKIQDRIDEYQLEIDRRTDYESPDYMDLVQRMTDAHEQFERRGGLTMHADVERVLTGLGFLQQELDNPLTAFSGGWQMRAELGRLLLSKPEVLLLDEPTNHLDIESVQWLEEFLITYDGAVILISHDRTFLDNITNRTIEITRSKVHDMNCAYSDYEEIRAERMEQQKAAAVRQNRERERVQKFIDRFRYKASLASRAQSRIKALAKMEVIEVEDTDTASMHFTFPPAPRAGRIVVDCIDVVKNYGEKKVLRGTTFHMERGEKVAFIGKNGEGKTTLSKLIGGLEPATSGEIRIGHGVIIGYYAQHQADLLGGHNTVYEVMEQASPPEMRPRIRSLLGAFLFSGDEVNKRVSVLSGGEKSRLALARLLLQPTNLLILDEPTNHLDMLSKEVLKQALMEYDGSMIVVSHDRDFLDGLTERVFAFRLGTTKEYLGDIDDYVNSLKQGESGKVRDSEVRDSEVRDSKVRDSTVSDVKSVAAALEPVKPHELTREEVKELNRQKKKLEKRIEDIERQVGVQEKTIAECEKEMADPELYKDPVQSHKITKRYETAKQLVTSLMAEWETCSQQLEGVGS